MRFLFAAICILFSFGCATKVKTTEAANLSTLAPQTTGFLFTYKFEAEDQVVGQDGCSVVFKNLQSGEKIQLDVKYGKEFLLAETKPGIYFLHDFSCGRYTWDLTDATWAQFHVQQGKISAIAPMRIRVSDTRKISTRIPNRKGAYQQMMTVWGLLNDETKKSLISGYTLKPINEELLQNNDSWGDREISRDGKKFEKVKKAKLANFKSCYAGEGETNGLWLGQLRVDIDYRSGAPAVAIEDGKHTFSDHFVECVKSKIIEFKDIDAQVQKARIVL